MMADGRSNRKAKVIPFVDRIEHDRKQNLQALVSKAKLMQLEGFDAVEWSDEIWHIIGGRLVKLTGKNTKSASFHFLLPKKLGSCSLKRDWQALAKALFILRFHRKYQATPNQRSFITAVGYVAHAASALGQDVSQLTPEALDNACLLISKHYGAGTAYNLHKHVAELAAHCDANDLCRVLLQYKFSKMKRPASTGGLNHKRLDDPEVLKTKSDKLVDPVVFRIIGELYLNVPKDYKYRFYVLMLTMLACTGRRFSEVALMPYQGLSIDEGQKAFVEYFPRKVSRGDVFTPKRKLYLPSEVSPIVGDVLIELDVITKSERSTAEEMQKVNGPDLQFLANTADDKKLYVSDLAEMEISNAVLNSTSWLRKKTLSGQIITLLRSKE